MRIDQKERDRRGRVVMCALSLLLVMVVCAMISITPPMHTWQAFTLTGSLLCAFLVGVLVGLEMRE